MSSHRDTSWTCAWVLLASVCACTSQPLATQGIAAESGSTNSSANTAANSGSTNTSASHAGAAASGAAAPGAAASGAAASGAAASGAAASGAAASGAASGAAASGAASDAAASGAAASGAGASGAAASGAATSGSTAGATGTDGTAADSCSNRSVVFCDDFERNTAGMPPAAPWTIANNGMGHAVIDMESTAHSGKASVKVTSEGGYQTFFALTGAPAFPHDGPLYLRVYMRLDAPMTGGHNTYYKAGASGASSSDHETRVGVMNGMLMINQPAGDRGFLSNEDYYRDGNMPGVVFAPMTWVCIETFFDPANKAIDVWVDGNEVPDLHRTDWEQDPIGALHFGFEKYAGPDATIWYDDIALGTQPIGCR